MRQRVCYGRNRIILLGVTILQCLTMRVDAFMHIGHEIQEMSAALAFGRHELVKHIHQHRLAASDLTVNIETLDDLATRRTATEQPAQRT